MLKINFLIHDLGQGGAEKVLVNLVNHLNRQLFDVSVTVLFGGGVNEQFLAKDIKLHKVFPRIIPANTKWMKLATPQMLHDFCIKEQYDIEVSYLEGPSARVIAGCRNPKTKTVSWIHVEQKTVEKASQWFRSRSEAERCYQSFAKTICVSQTVKEDFEKLFPSVSPCEVLYNTVDSTEVLRLADEKAECFADDGKLRMIAVGSLKKAKGYERLIAVTARLIQKGYPIHLFILGIGPLETALKELTEKEGIASATTFLGYQTNPYRYVVKSDLLVCSSYAEGFSTAVTEALIVGTPVCTVRVSGMNELLGTNNEYGIVTDNTEQALEEGIRYLLDNPTVLEDYRVKAKQRGESFSKEATVQAVEEMLLNL